MYKCKVYCEADVYVRLPLNDATTLNPNDSVVRSIYSQCSETINITNVIKVSSAQENELLRGTATIFVEVLVKYDAHVTHINDYKIRGCQALRRELTRPGLSVGVVLAPSIETYNSPRSEGFQHV